MPSSLPSLPTTQRANFSCRRDINQTSERLCPFRIMYAFVALFNVTMWGCFVNSLKSLSSLQATVTNFATNFISSGLAGFFFFFHA